MSSKRWWGLYEDGKISKIYSDIQKIALAKCIPSTAKYDWRELTVFEKVSMEQIEQIMSDIYMRWLRRDKDMLEGTIDGIDSGDTRKRLSVVVADAILKLLGEKP